MTTPLLAAGVLGPFIFVVVTLTLGAIRPDYSAMRTFISQLCLDGRGRWQTANFVVSGLLIALFGVGLSPLLGSPPVSGWGWFPVVWAGAGIVGIGIIHDDAWLSYPPGAPDNISWPRSTHGWAHLVVSALTGVGLFVGFVAFAAQWDGRWLVYSLATIFFFLYCYALAVYSGFHSDNPGPPGGKGGLFQRLSMFSAFLWIAVLAWRLL